MSAVVFEAPASGELVEQSATLPKMSIAAEGGAHGGLVVEIPLQPRGGISIEVPTLNWQQVARPGRKALLEQSGSTLSTVQLTLNIMHVDPELVGTSIDKLLSDLRYLAEQGPKVTVYNTPQMPTGQVGPAGWWRITACHMVLEEFVGGSRQPKKATVTMTLTEESEAQIKVGPLTDGIDSGLKAVPVLPGPGEAPPVSYPSRSGAVSAAAGTPPLPTTRPTAGPPVPTRTQAVGTSTNAAEHAAAYEALLATSGRTQAQIVTGIAKFVAGLRGLSAADWKVVADASKIALPWGIPTTTTVTVPRTMGPAVPQVYPTEAAVHS